MATATTTTIKVYHEKQSRELCAVHSLNNVFQEQIFTKELLDEICIQLSPAWINPHRSVLGLGNYDINVIMSALKLKKNCEAIWFDKRKDPETIDTSKVVGFILNIPSKYEMAGLFTVPLLGKRHWVAIKEINGQFYNLDSKLREPDVLGNRVDAIAFLRKKLQEKDNELFIISELEAQENGEQVEVQENGVQEQLNKSQ